jgi:SAM-dependent methyltransferase
LAIAISKLSDRIVGRVLDFGCGSKPYQSIFKAATAYTGVDIEVSGHSHIDSKVDFYYDGKRLPFLDGEFDSVVSFEVVEHVFNLDEILREIHRVLKPGGVFLMSAPFAWEEHEKPYDFARYTSFGLSHVLQSQGFEVLDKIKTTSHFLAACQMLQAYLSHQLAPRGVYARRLFIFLVIFPINLLVLALDRILPKSYDYYCNNVVLCRRVI